MRDSQANQQEQDKQYGARADDGVKVTTPFGSIQAHGPMVIVVVLVICAVAIIGYMVRDHDMRSAESFVAIQKNQSETAYIMTVCFTDKARCEALQIDMPDSLRQKVRERRDAR